MTQRPTPFYYRSFDGAPPEYFPAEIIGVGTKTVVDVTRCEHCGVKTRVSYGGRPLCLGRAAAMESLAAGRTEQGLLDLLKEMGYDP